MDRPGFPASILVAFFFVLLLSPACEQGLSPESLQHPTSRYGIKGTVHFRNWPPQDTIVDLRAVSFKHLPSQNILDEVLQGRAGFTPSPHPDGAVAIAYTLILSPIPAGAFAYTAVAQQFGQNVNTGWRAVGLYPAAGGHARPGPTP